ncbi:DEKNAAC103154 [Brettanomyces naardenensis]|uniref:DEKNAAC103154 n=1 Tax=Brettanomyces naardenensis TaxID=13370 RepID=A0A448YME3_BRENA|nr:DEKNAAC103154 [Brettanomyces naardenensis]
MKNRQLLEEATQNPLGAQKALEVPNSSGQSGYNSAEESDGNDKTHQTGNDGAVPEGMLTLPMSRIKRIVKLDPEHISSTEAANYMLGVGAELFVMNFTSQAASVAKTNKRKKIQYSDVHKVVSGTDNLLFLKDLVPKTSSLGQLVKEKKVRLREADYDRLVKTGVETREVQVEPSDTVQQAPAVIVQQTVSVGLPTNAPTEVESSAASTNNADNIPHLTTNGVEVLAAGPGPVLAKGQSVLPFEKQINKVETALDGQGDVVMID